MVGLRSPATATLGSVYRRDRAATFAFISRAGYDWRMCGRLRFNIHETSHLGSNLSVDPLATVSLSGPATRHLAAVEYACGLGVLGRSPFIATPRSHQTGAGVHIRIEGVASCGGWAVRLILRDAPDLRRVAASGHGTMAHKHRCSLELCYILHETPSPIAGVGVVPFPAALWNGSRAGYVQAATSPVQGRFF